MRQLILILMATAALAACGAPAETTVATPAAPAAAPARPSFETTVEAAKARMAESGGPALTDWQPLAMVDDPRACSTADGWVACASPDGRLQDLKLSVSGDGRQDSKVMSPLQLRTLVAAIAPDAPESDWARIQRNLFEALDRGDGFVFVDDGRVLRTVRVQVAGSSWSMTTAADLEGRV